MRYTGTLILAVIAVCGSPLLAGCNRTANDDAQQTSQVEIQAVEPVAAASSGQASSWNLPSKADRVNNWKPGPSAPRSSVPLAVAAQAINCSDESDTSERVRVVCE